MKPPKTKLTKMKDILLLTTPLEDDDDCEEDDVWVDQHDNCGLVSFLPFLNYF